MLSHVRLPLTFDAAELAAETATLADADWIPHFNTAYYEGDWSGVSLYSVGGAPGTLYPDPTATGSFAPTPVLGRLPRLAAAIERFECPLQAVRLLRLGPGARVREHRDYRLGYDDGEVRIHVPLTTNPGAEFLLEGEPIDMAPGEAWYVDFNRPHAVANGGDRPRVHLVVDCEVNPWLDEVLHRGEAAA